MTLILASTSAIRRQMLGDAGVPFEASAPALDEEEAKIRFADLAPADLAMALAEAKAESVTGDLVLGCDSVVELDGERIDKPGPALADVLRRLSGRAHRLHSAAVLTSLAEPPWRAIETVTLTVRELSDTFIADYVARDSEARWSAGGYRVEGIGVQLFEKIEGSHFAILGLPLLPLLAELRRRGVLAS